MALNVLTLEQLDAQPDNAPVWVLNNSMSIAAKHSRNARPSDVLIDVRNIRKGELTAEQIERIVKKVGDAMSSFAGQVSEDAAKHVRTGMAVLRTELSGEIAFAGNQHTVVKVPHDYRGYPFNCTDIAYRSTMLHDTNFRRAVTNGLILPISEADAAWLIAELEVAYADAPEVDRHEVFNRFMCGSEAEKEASSIYFTNPVDRVRKMFEDRAVLLAEQARLAARPWYVKLWARVKGEQ